MDVRPIRTDDDLDWALAQVARYFDDPPPPGSAEADRFDVLSTLIAAYEESRFPIPPADPIEMLQAYMEMTGRTRTELARLLGSRSHASEVMNRRRPLSIEMIRKLHNEWGIPAEILIRPSEAA